MSPFFQELPGSMNGIRSAHFKRYARDGFGHELGPGVRSDLFRDAVTQHRPSRHLQNVLRGLPAGNVGRQVQAG